MKFNDNPYPCNLDTDKGIVLDTYISNQAPTTDKRDKVMSDEIRCQAREIQEV